MRLAVAGARPSALDPNAEAVLRIAPGAGEALLVGLDAALSGDEGNLGGAATAAGSSAAAVRAIADFLAGAGSDVVILYSERLLTGPRGSEAAHALLNLAVRLKLRERAGAGLLEIPWSRTAAASARPASRPRTAPATRTWRRLRGAADRDAAVLYLLHADPLRNDPDRAAWEAALGAAQTVICHASTLTETVREHAHVVFPAEAYPRRRARRASGRPRAAAAPGDRPPRLAPGAGVRPAGRSSPTWRPAGLDLGVHRRPDGLPAAVRRRAVLRRAVARRDRRTRRRWPATRLPPRSAPAVGARALDVPALDGTASRHAAARHLALAVGAPEVDLSPALQFMRPRQLVELSPVDADRLGVRDGDQVEVGTNGTRVRSAARLRASVPAARCSSSRAPTTSPPTG